MCVGVGGGGGGHSMVCEDSVCVCVGVGGGRGGEGAEFVIQLSIGMCKRM